MYIYIYIYILFIYFTFQCEMRNQTAIFIPIILLVMHEILSAKIALKNQNNPLIPNLFLEYRY